MLEQNEIRALLVYTLLPFGAHAQEDPAVAALHRLEAEMSQALVERDAAALDRLWHEDLVFIGTNGRQFTKAERLAGQQIAEARRAGETNTNDDVDVRIEGDLATVVVTSTWTIPTDAAVTKSRFRALHVWTRAGGQWRLLGGQVAVLRD